MSLLHIYDLSAYQPATVPTCDAVFIKATEGSSYVSSQFDAQWRSAASRAKKRGAYHFARPEASSANDQADRFLSVSGVKPGEMACLDLELSSLSQSATNTWARAFGSRLRSKAPGVKTVLYMGAGYASSTTGRGLADYFDLWWYPQYPSAYQVKIDDGDATELEEWRARNRSSLISGVTKIAPETTGAWPGSVSPWLPSGLTCGWAHPHLWQFTDNEGGYDASVSSLTLEQLAGGTVPPTPPSPQEGNAWFL